jgi:hypothetical protein
LSCPLSLSLDDIGLSAIHRMLRLRAGRRRVRQTADATPARRRTSISELGAEQQLNPYRSAAVDYALVLGAPTASVEIDGLTDTAATGVVVPATGGPTRYSFYNASTVLNGDVESITGYFDFDPLTLL